MNDNDLAVMVEHLRHNFYPPLPGHLAAAALEAVEACRAGDGERVIVYEGGEMAAGALVAELRLEDMV